MKIKSVPDDQKGEGGAKKTDIEGDENRVR